MSTTSSRCWHHRAHPRVLDVAQHQRAERAVVVAGPEAAVDLRRRVHEPASLAEVDDLFQVGRWHRAGQATEPASQPSRTSPRCAGGARCGAHIARVACAATSWVAGDSGTDSASLSRPPSTMRISVERSGAERRAACGSCGTARRPGPCRRPRAGPARRSGRRRRARGDAFGGEQLPVERRDHQRAGASRDGAQRADQHAVQVRRRLAVERQLIDRLEQGDAVGHVVEVGDQRGERLDRLGLADDVELGGRGRAAVAHGSSARAGRRTWTSSCEHPWRRRAPCRGARSSARRCGRPRRACTCATPPPVSR